MKNNIKFIVLFVFVFLSGMLHAQAQESGFISFFKKILSLQAAKELSEPMTEGTRVGATNSITLKPGFSSGGFAFEAEISNQMVFPYYDQPEPYGHTNYIISYSPLVKMNATDMNYALTIKSGTVNRATVDQMSTQVAIFDGLGRPMQQMAIQASPLCNDIVTFNEYDDLGREKVRYLPFSLKTNGESLTNPILEQENFYLNPINRGIQIPIESNAFAEIIFDGSPLNRVMKQGAPGADWQPVDNTVRQTGEHVVSYEYGTNTIGEVCLLNVLQDGTLSKPGEFSNYSPNTIYVNSILDENGNETKEYKNQLDQVIQKSSYEKTTNTWVKTRYVYDDFGLLRYVLPPMAIDAMTTNWNDIHTGTTTTVSWLANYAYYYAYDNKNRMIEKKLPGVLPVKMYYDDRDRLVLTQDGNMHLSDTQGDYLFTAYDAFNRPVVTGVVNIQASEENLRTYAKDYTKFQANSLNLEGYIFSLISADEIGVTVTTGSQKVQTETYYDNYDYKEETVRPFVKDLLLLTDADAQKTKGFVTGTKTRIGEAINGEVGEWAYESLYYDEYGRMVYSHKTVDFGDAEGVEKTTTKYSFSGLVLETKQEQTFNDVTTTVHTTMQYDHVGRLLTTTQGINSLPAIEIASMEYDELGQLAKKILGDSLQDVDYQYNIRGWLTHINNPNTAEVDNDLYAQELFYNNTLANVTNDLQKQFNGNISAIRWTGSGAENQAYGFSYDGLNRLKNASYAMGATLATNNNYNENIGYYDLNGNIIHLERKGISDIRVENSTEVPVYGLIDVLIYKYSGNKLIGVNDACTSVKKMDGFSDGLPGDDSDINDVLNQTTWEYTYDFNGNLTSDKNKGITSIVYNHLNLPIQISFAGGINKINYLYDAAGTKYRKTSSDDNGTRYYFSNFEYDNTMVLDYIHTGEGRIRVKSNYTYDYYLKDHLGNTRVVFADTNSSGIASILQLSDYYPFGMTFKNPNQIKVEPTQYLYNGKELQEDFGLNLSDYGARYYDPALGRWHVMDPMAEKYFSLSTYNYALNNPILFIDPDGRDVDLGNLYDKDEDGNYKYKTQILAFEIFASSKAGGQFLSERAQKGFKFEAAFIKKASFEAEEGGALSGEINANFKVADLSEYSDGAGADGLTETSILEDGKLDVTYSLDKNLGKLKSPTKSPENEYIIMNSTNTLFHEVFIHGYNKEKNYNEGQYDGIKGRVTPNGGYEHNNIDKTPYRGITYPLLKAINGIFKLGATDEKIWKEYID